METEKKKKKPFTGELHQSSDSHLLNGDPLLAVTETI